MYAIKFLSSLPTIRVFSKSDTKKIANLSTILNKWVKYNQFILNCWMIALFSTISFTKMGISISWKTRWWTCWIWGRSVSIKRNLTLFEWITRRVFDTNSVCWGGGCGGHFQYFYQSIDASLKGASTIFPIHACFLSLSSSLAIIYILKIHL